VVAPEQYSLRPAIEGLTEPVYLTYANGDSSRLFIVEQPGTIRIWREGQLLPQPFLDIQDLVNDEASERGLLGLAFHPDYPNNGQFFVNYTDVNGDTVVARYRVSDDPDRADPASAQTVLAVDQPYANHNGGDLVFGPDGYLYIGLGDGGSAGDPQNNAQNLGSLLGKMLRIDVNQDPYGVPNDNPFVQQGGARPEIWAYGLRNPWRYSFDRATRDLFIADVGQNQIEEVDFQPADSRGGENYGWRFMEGSGPYKGSAPDGLIPPVTEYTHAEGGCSITGGYVYRGQALPALDGVYFFGDYCTGYIWSLRRTASGAWEKQLFLESGLRISSFGEDPAGELYVVHHGGTVYQLVAGGG
jgi:glucose/arabinose dehydrogenase